MKIYRPPAVLHVSVRNIFSRISSPSSPVMLTLCSSPINGRCSSFSMYHLPPVSCLTNTDKIFSPALSRFFSSPVNNSNSETMKALDMLYPEGDDVVKFFRQLARKLRSGELTLEQVGKDKIFEDVCQDLKLTLSTDFFNHRLTLTDIICILDCLKNIGFESGNELIEQLDKAVFLKVAEGNLPSLIEVYKFYSRNETSTLRTQIIRELNSEIDAAIERETDLSLLIRLYKRMDDRLSPSIINAVDNRLTNSFSALTVGEIDPNMLMKMLVMITDHKKRPTPLLKSIYTALKAADLNEYPEPGHLVNAICAINILNFPDAQLLEKLGQALINLPDWTMKVKASSISALLVACGKMNWRFAPFLDVIASDFAKRNFYSSPQMISFTLAAARVDHKPINFDEIVEKNILPEVIKSFESSQNPLLWLDFVYSLAILDSAPADIIKSVLDKEFLENLKKFPDAEYAKWKLLNLITKANLLKLNIDETLDLTSFKPPPRPSPTLQQGAFVTEHLKNFIVRDKFLATSLVSPVGGYIDAEFIVDKDLKALPMEEYGTHNLPDSMKDLPPGFKRICVIAAGFKETILDQPLAIGSIRFMSDLLSQTQNDTKALVLTQLDINPMISTIDRIRCLKGKIENVFVDKPS
ncbi:FAST kinase domain-containing protein 4 [Brevipalpus obovatus]|uniref:FAST kinase domain-containing protein 4 n=1 Tax=Brevipalpus obovatus TaxID=246614 RepID=UPI003D9EB4C9